MILEETKEEILSFQDEEYRNFQIKLLPDIKNFAGVRLPKLRKIAKRIAKENGADYLELVLDRCSEEELFEEIMLQGMIIGYMKTDISDIFSYTEKFVPKIDNWSVCDSFCSGWKHVNDYPEETWKFLQTYLKSEKEFEVRFGIVMLLNYYINEEYIKELFLVFDTVKQESYYVKMAVAWAISICYIKYSKLCIEYLNNNDLDNFTYHKALQKITESRCVSKEEKEKIRKMKRK